MILWLLKEEYRRLLQRSPARLTLLGIYLVLALWAGLDGLVWKSTLEVSQRERPAELKQDRVAWTQELQDVHSGKENSVHKARPMNLSLLASLPPGPLSQLAHRGETIHPHTAILSGWQNDATLFRRYEIEGPSALAMRGLDLNYVVIVFLPLVLLLSTFDAISSERNSKRLRLLMVQGLDLRTLLWVRVAAVALVLWAATCAIAVGVSFDGFAHPLRLLLWLGACSAYSLFWSAVAAWLALRFKQSSQAAMAAMGLWVGLVLLVPSFVQFVIEAAHPTPSRVAYLMRAREAESKARKDVEKRAELFMAEHAIEVAPNADKVPSYFRTYYLANRHINAKTAPIVQNLQDQRDTQTKIANLVEFVSPPLLSYRVLQEAAGAGSERAAQFRHQVRGHLAQLHQRIGPAIVAKRRLTLEQAHKVPDFRFQETPLSGSTWLGLAWLLGLSTLLLARSSIEAKHMSP